MRARPGFLLNRALNPVMRALTFRAPLKTSLLLTKGSGTPTFARASTATIVDFEGVVRPVLSGEARFPGMRRVRNLAPTSQVFTGATGWNRNVNVNVASGVTDPLGGNTASTITANLANAYILTTATIGTAGATFISGLWVRRRTGVGTITMARADGNNWSVVISPTSTWQFFWNKDGSGGQGAVGLQLATSGDQVDVAFAQLEDVTGQSAQTPGEYVPTGTGGPNFGVELGTLPYVARGTVTGSGTFTATTTSVATTQYGVVMALPSGALVAGKTYRIYAKLNSKATTDPTQQLAIYASTDQNSGIGAAQLVISNTSGAFVLFTPGTTQTLTLRSDTGTATVGDSWNFTLSVTECLFSGANVEGVQYFSTRLDGRPIYEPLGPSLGLAANFGVPVGYNNALSSVTDSGFSSSAGSGADTRAYCGITTIPGRTYEVAFVLGGAGSLGSAYARDGAAGLGTILASQAYTVAGSYIFRFTAASSTTNVLWSASPVNAFAVANFRVQELKPLDGLGIEQVAVSSDTFSAKTGYTAITGAAAVIGRQYKISYDYSVTAGATQATSGGASFPIHNAPAAGSYSAVFTATSTVIPQYYANAATGSISNFTVREVTQPSGYLNEPSRTNAVTNSTCAGAAAGTPGTLPSNWSVGLASTGLSRSVVGTGTLNGIPYVDIRFFGTSAGGNVSVYPVSNVAAANGQQWQFSYYMALVGGSFANITGVGHSGNLFNATPTYLGELALPSLQTSSITSSLTRFAPAAGTIAQATAAFASPYIYLPTSAGAVDVTLRIGLPQFEQGASASSPMPTSSGAFTRAADSLSYQSAGNVSNAMGSVIVSWTPTDLATGSQPVLGIQSTNGNDSLSMYQNAATSKQGVDSGGVNQATITSGNSLAAVKHKMALSYTSGRFAGCTDGGTVTVVGSGAVPGNNFAAVYVGAYRASFPGAQTPMVISDLAIYSQPLPDALLKALTA